MIDRKQHVFLTAQRLFLEKGFSATSVQDILEESGISKGTFYNYFSSKNECLIAILEHAYDEALIRRQELIIGKDVSNKNILAKQIAVRTQVNREHNLMPLFGAIFHSKDAELKAFIKKQLLTELAWLSERLVDVYGQEAKPYSLDCAVMLIGMIQHYHVSIPGSNEDLEPEIIVQFILRRMDSIISGMISTDDKLLDIGIFLQQFNQKRYSKEQLLEKLYHFLASLDNKLGSKQYLEFLIDELQSEQPRVPLVETVIRSFREAFIGTSAELEAQEIALHLYHYLNTLKK